MRVPLLLVGVFLAGVAKVILPPSWVGEPVAGDTLSGNFIASISEGPMYFVTFAEVPITKNLMASGMGRPRRWLCSFPARLFPWLQFFTIQRVVGTKKMLSHVAPVVIFSTFTGLIFGLAF